MKFPQYIQMIKKLPKFKRPEDTQALLSQIFTLRDALERHNPVSFAEMKLLMEFGQNVLTRQNPHDPYLHFSPKLSTEGLRAADAALQALLSASAITSGTPEHLTDAPVSLRDEPIKNTGTLDEDVAALCLLTEGQTEQSLLAAELSQYIDIEHPHAVFTSFQHATLLNVRNGVYQGLSEPKRHRAAQLILANLIAQDALSMRALASDAHRFLCHAPQLLPDETCPRGLWDWAMAHRRTDNRKYIILACSLLNPNTSRPLLSVVLDCRAALNFRHDSQWLKS